MIDLMLFGIQGSGKGTQGKLIAEQFGYHIFEAGRELRHLAEDDSDLGRKVKSIIEAGNLVPDEVIMEIVAHFVAHAPAGASIIFDGIPRNMSQAQLFDALMERVGRKPYALSIEISDQEALARLSSRRLCSGCKKIFPAAYTADTCDVCDKPLVRRADDTPESIMVRLQHFHTETTPVIAHYDIQNRVITVNGAQDITNVTADIARHISVA